MSQSPSSIYSKAPQDIPKHHACIRQEEDTALCFIMETTLIVIPQCHFVAHSGNVFLIQIKTLCINTSVSSCC